jgi:hypothetical protein
MSPQRPLSSKRRGVALIIAISVLAILTIIVTGLAASQQAASTHNTHSADRQQALSMIRFGLGCAKSLLTHNPVELAGKPKIVELEQGKCVISAKIAPADDPCYKGQFIKPRPLDVIVTIQVEGPRVASRTQEFLVNVSDTGKRVIRLVDRAGK